MKTIEKLKRTVKTGFIPVVLLVTAIAFTSCNNDDEPVMDEKNVVEVAAEAGNFNILIQAAQKAGLADFLSTQNGITVFAPTDAAFRALLTDLGASSLDDLPVETLKKVLMYHVIGQKVMSPELKTGYYPTLAKWLKTAFPFI